MGVDPGLVATGFAVLEAAPGAVTVIDAGVITTVATQSLEARLNAIHRAVLDIIESRRTRRHCLGRRIEEAALEQEEPADQGDI